MKKRLAMAAVAATAAVSMMPSSADAVVVGQGPTLINLSLLNGGLSFSHFGSSNGNFAGFNHYVARFPSGSVTGGSFFFSRAGATQ